MVTPLRIGAGAGYSGDRIEPAADLAEHGHLHYLVFECLAERTIALAQLARQHDPSRGFDPGLERRMRMVLPSCRRNGVTVITNMGAANPGAAASLVRQVANDLGLRGLRVAFVTGDDVLAEVRKRGCVLDETGEPAAALGDRLISANAYIGVAPIIHALEAGADVVITGRAADPSLFLAPMVHHFGWALDDWPRLGAGTVVGHLLECAGQVTGGYFADPGVKDVFGLARLGFPLAEVAADGTAVITKLEGSGGCVTRATCKEQLLYEIHDPSAYATPDVVADFSGVRLAEDGRDRIGVSGGSGREKPSTLKVSVGYRDGFVGEGQISYAGIGAVDRAKLAVDIVRERLLLTGVAIDELRCDIIGVNALAAGLPAAGAPAPAEVRVRIVGRVRNAAEAERIGAEVETLYTNGPAGGAGAARAVREVVAVASTYIPAEGVACSVDVQEA